MFSICMSNKMTVLLFIQICSTIDKNDSKLEFSKVIINKFAQLN